MQPQFVIEKNEEGPLVAVFTAAGKKSRPYTLQELDDAIIYYDRTPQSMPLPVMERALVSMLALNNAMSPR